MAFLGHYILAVKCSAAHKLTTKQNISYSALQFQRLLKNFWLNIETIMAH